MWAFTEGEQAEERENGVKLSAGWRDREKKVEKDREEKERGEVEKWELRIWVTSRVACRCTLSTCPVYQRGFWDMCETFSHSDQGGFWDIWSLHVVLVDLGEISLTEIMVGKVKKMNE